MNLAGRSGLWRERSTLGLWRERSTLGLRVHVDPGEPRTRIRRLDESAFSFSFGDEPPGVGSPRMAWRAVPMPWNLAGDDRKYIRRQIDQPGCGRAQRRWIKVKSKRTDVAETGGERWRFQNPFESPLVRPVCWSRISGVVHHQPRYSDSNGCEPRFRTAAVILEFKG